MMAPADRGGSKSSSVSGDAGASAAAGPGGAPALLFAARHALRLHKPRPHWHSPHLLAAAPDAAAEAVLAALTGQQLHVQVRQPGVRVLQECCARTAARVYPLSRVNSDTLTSLQTHTRMQPPARGSLPLHQHHRTNHTWSPTHDRQVHGADGLRAAGFNGACSSCVSVRFAGVQHSSAVVPNNRSPAYQCNAAFETASVLAAAAGAAAGGRAAQQLALQFEVWHRDKLTTEFLGQAKLSLRHLRLLPGCMNKLSLPLQVLSAIGHSKHPGQHGDLTVSVWVTPEPALATPAAAAATAAALTAHAGGGSNAGAAPAAAAAAVAAAATAAALASADSAAAASDISAATAAPPTGPMAAGRALPPHTTNLLPQPAGGGSWGSARRTLPAVHTSARGTVYEAPAIVILRVSLAGVLGLSWLLLPERGASSASAPALAAGGPSDRSLGRASGWWEGDGSDGDDASVDGGGEGASFGAADAGAAAAAAAATTPAPAAAGGTGKWIYLRVRLRSIIVLVLRLLHAASPQACS